MHKCYLSGKELSSERVEALRFLGTPEVFWTAVEESQVTRKQAVIANEDGDIIIASKAGQEGLEWDDENV